MLHPEYDYANKRAGANDVGILRLLSPYTNQRKFFFDGVGSLVEGFGVFVCLWQRNVGRQWLTACGVRSRDESGAVPFALRLRRRLVRWQRAIGS